MAEHVDHVELIFGIDAERNSGSNGGGPLQKIVANLWTEFAARRRDALIAYGNELQTLINSWWLQPSKRQNLAFCRTCDLGPRDRRFESSRPDQ